VTEDSGHAAWLRQARSRLREADPVLARLIDDRPDFDPRAWLARLPAMDLFGALLFQVTGQQLSVAATRRILDRIQALFGGHLPLPAELLAVDPGQLRKAVRAAYQLDHLPTQQEVLAIAEKWRPYRSLATSYLFSAVYEPAQAPPVPPRQAER
jgi:3-methyladenine DNA glycosylase/8-oxoguanine DNA glycosylase